VRARVEMLKRVLNEEKAGLVKPKYAQTRKYHWGNKWNVAEKVMRKRLEDTLSC
jgi:hypothetical protein